MDLKGEFGDCRFVIMQGSADRTKDLANFFHDSLGLPFNGKEIGKTERYSMYKVGHVLCISHGMGMPSLSIALNEVYKLLHYAGCLDKCIFIRCGTCGGIGIAPGSVVLSKECCDVDLNHFYTQSALGKHFQYPAIADPEVVHHLQSLAEENGIPVAIGVTMTTNGFYEDQGRLDGYFCDYEEADKLAYLQKLHAEGVSNIEMEAMLFLALARRAGVKAGVVCSVIVDRLKGDQVTATAEELEEYMQMCWKLLSLLVRD